MAKFAIALCILLVAYGVQGDLTDDILNQISLAVESFVKEVQSYASLFEHRFTEAVSNAANFKELVDSTMERAIEEWEMAREELSTLSENPEVLSACMSWSDNFGDMTDEIQSNVNSCIGDSLSSVTDQYESSKASFEEFINYLKDAEARAEECLSNFWTAITCLASITAEVTKEAVQTWNELQEKNEAFGSDLFSFEGTVNSCNFISILQNIVKQRQEIFTETEQCINDLQSATAS